MSSDRVDILTTVAREKAGRPDAQMIVITALDLKHDGIDATRVTLADVPDYVRGPKIGKPNYKASTNRQPVYVLPADVDAWLAAHPDVCGRCNNEREVFVQWTAEDGTTTRPCPACTPSDGEGTDK